MTERQLKPGDEIEVRQQPYPGARVSWVRAEVETTPNKMGEFMAKFLGGATYQGATRTMVKPGGWR